MAITQFEAVVRKRACEFESRFPPGHLLVSFRHGRSNCGENGDDRQTKAKCAAHRQSFF
jgi:hypothetical protein